MSSKVAPLPGFVSIGSVRPSTAVSTSRPGTAPEGQDVVFYNDRSVVESQFDLARPRTAAETQEADTLHFLQTPWVAPNLQKAQRNLALEMYGEGSAPIWATSMDDLNELGVCVTFYFRLLKYFAISFFVMTLIAVPSFVVLSNSNRMQDFDLFHVASLSLANAGPVGRSVDWRACHPLAPSSCVGDMDFKLSHGHAIPFRWAALLFPVVDCLNTVIFLVLILFLRARLQSVTRAVDGKLITAADYTVFVRGLPKDVTEEEVLNHFNSLYDLGNADWTFSGFAFGIGRKMHKRREELTKSRNAAMSATESDEPSRRKFKYSVAEGLKSGPVLNATNTGQPMYLRTYIAEVVLCYANGSLLELYKAKRRMLMQVLNLRGRVKKYSKMSDAHDPARFTKHMRRLAELKHKMERFDAQHATKFSSDVTGAFVTFNCEGSVARCLEDYAGSHRWFRHYFQPVPLRFRDGAYRLSVSRAPEPTDVLWENVEVSPKQRRWRVIVSHALMIIILLLSTGVCIFLKSQQHDLRAGLPSHALCAMEMPAAVLGSYHFPKDVAIAHMSGNASCPGGQHLFTLTSSSFSEPSAWTPPEGDETALARASAAPAWCVLPACIGPSIKKLCFNPLLNTTFALASVEACYCAQSAMSIRDVLLDLLKPGSTTDICNMYVKRMTKAQLIDAAVSFLVVMINYVLKAAMRAVTAFERHMAFSNQTHHLILKLFVAQFLNTALMVLIVNAKMPVQLPYPLSSALSGTVPMFSPDWYPQVGVTIPAAMMVNIVMSQAISWSAQLLRRRRARWAIKFASSQGELERALSPPELNIAGPVANMLNTVFVALTYSSPFPVVLPIACVALFLQFWSQKYALLRWFRKPPRMSNAIGRLVLATLPYAVLIHTLVALFVYGDNDVLPSPPTRFTDPIYTERFHAALGALRDSRFDVMEISTILRRMSVFPSLVLLCALLVSYVVWKTMGGFITVVGKRLLWLITCGVLSSFDDGMVKERPMYTGPYLLRIPGVEGKEPVFDDIHARAGWQLIPDPTRPTGNMIQIKVWMTNGIMGGMRYRRGQRMLTWHVIHEQSLSTYNILMNPAYSAIMIAILEAHDRRHGGTASEALAIAKAWALPLSQVQPAEVETMEPTMGEAAPAQPTLTPADIQQWVLAEDESAFMEDIPAHKFAEWAEMVRSCPSELHADDDFREAAKQGRSVNQPVRVTRVSGAQTLVACTRDFLLEEAVKYRLERDSAEREEGEDTASTTLGEDAEEEAEFTHTDVPNDADADADADGAQDQEEGDEQQTSDTAGAPRSSTVTSWQTSRGAVQMMSLEDAAPPSVTAPMSRRSVRTSTASTKKPVVLYSI